PLRDTVEVREQAEEIRQQYSSLGFASTFRRIISIDDADIGLFKSFFAFDATRNRLIKKYDVFRTKQTRNLLGNPYEYIESPFEVFNGSPHQEEIFDLIAAIIERDSADLLIIEASAGYGKTCTAYELLKLIANKQEYRLPIF